MALTRDDVERAARLARIAIDDAEADQVLEQLVRIFGMIEEMSAVDVNLDRAGQQSGVDQERLKNLPNVYTGIWWYAKYPNHYSGDGTKANAQAGELLINSTVDQLVEMIQAVKKDEVVPNLQKQFYDESENPLKAKQ